MIDVGVIGATGYTGAELLRLLAGHRGVRLLFATARADAGKTLSELYPAAPAIRLQAPEEARLEEVKALFLCLPHGAAQDWTRRGLDAGAVVIDLSADHRLSSAALYRRVYEQEHHHPETLGEAVYGLTELVRDRLPRTRLIANPGCYPTSVLLALAPLARRSLLEGTVIADSKSGVSGAGRSPALGAMFVEVNENFAPYKLGNTHRHLAEMTQELQRLGSAAEVLFSPHLLPVSRGILSTLYVPWPGDLGAEEIRELYREDYDREPFVHVLPAGRTASLSHAVHTNRCALSLHPVPALRQLVIVSAIDNLIKGAAGQAVQNFNRRFGLDETEALAGCK
ncbi:MAG: N-acetyl-gamma-glutamyl-phosphate reductase [Armatimonadetes bacterium]|nr:N-acetyl-gamma-glutamyl-phosphate reductase [Armatimonadota bacterium]